MRLSQKKKNVIYEYLFIYLLGRLLFIYKNSFFRFKYEQIDVISQIYSGGIQGRFWHFEIISWYLY